MTTETKPLKDCCATETAVGESPAEARDGLPRLAAAFKALSDETRLRILKSLMAAGTLCECEIVPTFGLSQSTISYHLKVLREAGIVEAERRGVWAYYRVNPKALLGMVRELTDLA